MRLDWPMIGIVLERVGHIDECCKLKVETLQPNQLDDAIAAVLSANTSRRILSG